MSAGRGRYEEFHPYGSTAWWAHSTTVSLKRYRYTGMERDEETGLQCHGVRYYAPWLGRWTSADPIGLGDGVNRFAYVHGNPMGGRDADGRAEVGDAPSIFSSQNASAIWNALTADPKAALTSALDHPLDRALDVVQAVLPNGRGGPNLNAAADLAVNVGTGVVTAPALIPVTAENSYKLVTGTPSEKLAAVRDQRRFATRILTAGTVVLAAGTITDVPTAAPTAPTAPPEPPLPAPEPVPNPTTTPEPTPSPSTTPELDPGAPTKTRPDVVYRGGTRSPDNLTPRPGKDPGGLSTFDNLESAAPPGGKAQVIDTSKLQKVCVVCDDDPPGHVSLSAGSDEANAGWAAARGTPTVHPLTQELLDAVIQTVTRPK